MSELTHSNMNTITNKVTELKKAFIDQCTNYHNGDVHLLREMRILHGKAIYNNFLDELEISKKEMPSEEDYIRLSGHSSLLHVIHCHIRKCEKTMFQLKSDRVPSALTERAHEQLSAKNIVPTNNNKLIKIRTNETGTEELSIINPETERSDINQSNIFSDNPKKNVILNNNYQPGNTSDYINNLGTTEASRLGSDYNKNIGSTEKNPLNYENIKNLSEKVINNIKDALHLSGGADGKEMDVNNPTLVNYWADWCGYSKKFQKAWNDFKESAKDKFPNLQVTDLNVGKNEDLNNIAKKADVHGYPTVVMFHNGKRYNKVASNMTPNDLDTFVSKIINS